MKLFLKFTLKFIIVLNLCSNQLADLATKSPCEDFYGYACANYSKENPDNNYNEILEKLEYEMDKSLLVKLQDSFRHYLFADDTQTYYDKVGIYFKACCNERRENFKKYFEDVKPGKNLNWPLMGSKDQWLRSSDNFDFWSFLGQLQSYGLDNVIINPKVTENIDHSFDIQLAPAASSEADVIPMEGVIYILKALHLNVSEAAIKQLNACRLQLQEIAENYIATQKIVKEFFYKDVSLQLQVYLKNLLGQEFDTHTIVRIENPEYFDFLSHKNWSSLELEQWCNYLMIEFIGLLAQDKSKAFTPEACIKDLRKNFDLALNYIMFIQFFQNYEIKFRSALNQLVNKLKVVMEFLFDVNFLDLSQRQIDYLKTKLKAIKINVGNLPENCNYEIVQELYEDIPLLAMDNYYKNHLLLLRHRFKNSLRSRWNQSFYVNYDHNLGVASSPFYVHLQNMVVIPMASFQPSFFHYHHSSLEKFSLFGFVLAHEFTHAFDLTGLNYNARGNLLLNSTDIATQPKFAKALGCLDSHDDNRSRKDSQIINERLADLFAVRVAFFTYFLFYGSFKTSTEKEFFLSLAQFFCNKRNLVSDTHDADNVRLQFIVKNFPPFAHAFGCKMGSPMNPARKCRIY